MIQETWNGIGQEGGAAELIKWLKESKDFIVEQAPELSRQMVNYGFWEAAIWGTILLAISGALIYLAFKVSRYFRDEGDEIGMVFAPILIGIPVFIAIVPGLDYVSTALKCKMAPKLYVVERVARLIK